MQLDSQADVPLSIEHAAVRRNLASLRRALEKLALRVFHVRDDAVHLSYRATSRAIATHGHAALQRAIVRAVSHETGRPRMVNVDVIHHQILDDPLVVMRTASDDAVWVLLGSEYRGTLGLPWPSDRIA